MKITLAIMITCLASVSAFASGSGSPACLPKGVAPQAISVEGIGSNVRNSEAIAAQNAQAQLDVLKTECESTGKTFTSCQIDSYFTGGEPVNYYATATAQYACYQN